MASDRAHLFDPRSHIAPRSNVELGCRTDPYRDVVLMIVSRGELPCEAGRGSTSLLRGQADLIAPTTGDEARLVTKRSTQIAHRTMSCISMG